VRIRNPETGEIRVLVNGEWVPETPDEGILGALKAGAAQGIGRVGIGLADLVLTDEERAQRDAQGGFRNFATEADYAQTMQRHPIASAIGESVPYVVPALAASVATGGAGLLPALGAQAAVGGAVGAAQPGTLMERMERALADAAIGAAGEGVGRAVGYGLNRLVNPGMPRAGADVTDLLDDARGLGFKVLPSAEMGSGARSLRQTIEGGLASTPGGASVMNQVSQHNTAKLSRLAAEAIGETAEEAPTARVLAQARNRIGAEYDALFPRGRQIQVTQDALDEIKRIEDESVRLFIRGEADPIGNAVDRMKEVLEDGVIDAAELNAQQSRLGKLGHQALRGETSNPELGHGLLDMRKVLLDMAGESFTAEDAARFANARGQYRMLSALEAGANIDPVTGTVYPGRMASYLQRRDRAGFAEEGNSSPLYQAIRFMGRAQPELPTSGTAERSWLNNTLGGTAGMLGGATLTENDLIGGGLGLAAGIMAPRLLAQGYVKPWTQNWLTRQRNPGAIERGLMNTTGPLGQMFAQEDRTQDHVKKTRQGVQAVAMHKAAALVQAMGGKPQSMVLSGLAERIKTGDTEALAQAREWLREARATAAARSMGPLATELDRILSTLGDSTP
jgi:hypothetical protein